MNQRSRFHVILVPVYLILVSILSVTGQTKTTLRVATAQIPVSNDILKNSATIIRALHFAIKEDAEVLLTPEGALSGYRPKFDQAVVDKELKKIVKLASDAGIALALGTCFVEPD
ncbi:MAG: nitrilase-related carbon-nitrogen hydrolase, partial [Verrucomicrobiota bacterium]|nr:nitrilase-related carbon-nitrogen hydrolase [Verrucomicrobiota bacterium]